ncbi:MAG TPA: 8-amino-7-oxononanoate synthase [Methylomirabilota bacterium]|nr:8-amino-7-oxononanoate synthase [Methylomirabilota bacterium]
MNAFEDHLEAELGRIREAKLTRSLRQIDSAQGVELTINGRPVLNFSSNDYLGLATHQTLVEAAQRAVRDYGAGAGASRLICGSLQPHHQLDEAIAAFKGVEAALSFSTGYATAVGCIPALLSSSDRVIVDRLVHASIVDACRLSGAELRVFRHNDLNSLETILNQEKANGRTLIVTESVFSMDGDLAPLTELVALKAKHGAWLMVDEAHATGVFGQRRAGLIQQAGLTNQVEVQMGTLGKAVGASGGYIAGSRKLIDLLINKARSFIFSTAPVPAAAAAASAGLQLLASDEGAQLNALLWERIERFARELDIRAASPIVPILLGDEQRALAAAQALWDKGMLVPAIRYPTVKRGQARLRVTLTARHSLEQLSQLAKELHSWSGAASVGGSAFR